MPDVIYVMKQEDGARDTPSIFKIGRSGDAAARLKKIQTDSPVALTLLDTYPVQNPTFTGMVEKFVHAQLNEFRIRGAGGREFFEFPTDLCWDPIDDEVRRRVAAAVAATVPLQQAGLELVATKAEAEASGEWEDEAEIPATAGIMTAVELLREAKAKITALEAKVDLHTATIKKFMATSRCGILRLAGGDKSVSWKNVTSNRLDSKELRKRAADLPEFDQLIDDCTRPSTSRTFRTGA